MVNPSHKRSTCHISLQPIVMASLLIKSCASAKYILTYLCILIYRNIFRAYYLMDGMDEEEIKSREGVSHFSSSFSASYGIRCSYNATFWIGPAVVT